jgi:two-component system sensor histidine kinase AlgZ
MKPPRTEPSSPDNAQSSRHLYLPDFTDGRAVLGMLVIVVLTAVLIALAHDNDRLGFWIDLGQAAVFLSWICLCSAVLLQLMRTRLSRSTPLAGAVTVMLVIAALIAVISMVAYLLGQSRVGEALDSLFPRSPGRFVVRNVGIGAIVSGIVLRYLHVTNEWRRNVELQAQARVHALQARIRPHFLFNSMNTIASLTRSDPSRAEEAVQDLADLFRATLSDKRSEITLSDELEIARTYERIEKLRLGERLQVQWNTSALPLRAIVPSLIIQPLLENAIYHGIEPRLQGGMVQVTGEFANGLITLVVRNPLPDGAVARDGNRLALANIRERMLLVYDERATVKAGRFDDEYIVTLRFPFVDRRPAGAA